MTRLSVLWRRLRATVRPSSMEHRLDEEIRFHVDMQTEANVRRGMSAEAARRAAMLAFGGRDRFREDARDAYRARPLEELAQDVRHAVRVVRRAPAFASTVVLTLAIGIGATTVIYSVTDHVVIRQLPYAHADRLYSVRIIGGFQSTAPSVPANAAHFLAWRSACSLCDGLAAIRARVGFTLSSSGEPVRVGGIRASDNLLSMLGARAEAGRLFTPGDDRPGNEHLAVISDALWRERLGGRPEVVGGTILLSDVPFTVIGVLAPEVRLPRRDELGPFATMPASVDVVVPLALNAHERGTHGEYDYAVIALARDGVSPERLRAQLDAIDANAARALGDDSVARTAVVPLRAQMVGSARTPLLLLLAVVGAVLLIVCVNLANLLLARGAARRRESAVRVALGAGRERLVRQALTEAVVLSAIGGAAGICLSRWGLAALVRLAPADLPRLDEIRLDAPVVAVAALLSVLTGLSFGILPALRFGKTMPGDVLRESSRGSTEGPGPRNGRAWLIGAQVALSALLLVGTGLLLRSFERVLHVDRGFTADRVLAADVMLPFSAFPTPESRRQFQADALRQLAAIPGVRDVGTTSRLPLEGESWIDGIRAEGGAHDRSANFRFVSPSVFSTLGIPVRGGRAFTDAERGRRVVMLSAGAAHALWPAGDAVGKRLYAGSDSLSEVVGIVADVHTAGLEQETRLVVYLPYWQSEVGLPGVTVVVRTGGDPAALGGAVRAVLHRISPSIPVSNVRTMGQVVSGVVAQRRFELLLIVLFAATALVTASVGIYGIVANSIARRTGEIGIRFALGASPADVRRLVLVEALRPICAGAAVGIVAAVGLGRAFASLLFEVSPADPATLGAVLALVAAVGALACWVPARRASRLAPSDALRVG